MATIIAYYNSDGCQGRCDASCYNAIGPRCHCICGGANHGKGLAAALTNNADTIARLQAEHDAQLAEDDLCRIITCPVPPPFAPMPLFPNLTP